MTGIKQPRGMRGEVARTHEDEQRIEERWTRSISLSAKSTSEPPRMGKGAGVICGSLLFH